MMLTVRHLSLFLNQTRLLGPLTFDVAKGDIVTLMGPSGCGKSSLLAWMVGALPSPLHASGELWSTALSVLAMRSLGCSNIDYLVPNRFEDGYGLSPEVVDQAHARGAQLIVTVDNGISSHAGVEHARSLGIPVIVTDHHLPGDTLPAAEAIINPNLRDCNFPSKSLAGVGVVIGTQFFQTFFKAWDQFVFAQILDPDLGRNVQLIAQNAAFCNCLADSSFIIIDLCCIDSAITELQSRFYRCNNHIVLKTEST